ncbi:MAG: amidohydrolase family protein [Candidatus Bathyarchaeia archaeon]
MIIDCHQHLPSLKKTKSFERSKEKLLRELYKNEIEYAILIPDNTSKSEIGGLDEVLQLVKGEEQLYVMGTIDIQKRNYLSQIQKLDKLFHARSIVAVKIFPGHDTIYPTDKRLMPVYELCIKHDSPIVIHTGASSKHPEQAKYNDPKFIIKIAEKFPALKIVIAHYFYPKVEYCYNLTKGYYNIYFDISGLADDEVIAETGLAKIRKVLTQTVRERPNQVVFGTDYAMCSIKKHIELVESLEIERLAKVKIFSENAIKLFRLNL